MCEKMLFCYGTLLAEEVRNKVLKRKTDFDQIEKGYLKGYEVRRVKNANYPMLVKSDESKIVYGLIIKNLNNIDFNNLDKFEGGNYRKIKFIIFNWLEEAIECYVYFANQGIEYDKLWVFKDWYENEFHTFMYKDFNLSGVRNPL